MTRSPRPGLTLFIAALIATASCGYLPTDPSLPFAKVDLRVGEGAEATTGRIVLVHLQGWLHNDDRPDDKGIQFASTVNGTPIAFVLGGGDVITGINLGIIGMHVGGLRRLVVPPTLAYGSSGFGVIPPYANLVYEIELLDLQ